VGGTINSNRGLVDDFSIDPRTGELRGAGHCRWRALHDVCHADEVQEVIGLFDADQRSATQIVIERNSQGCRGVGGGSSNRKRQQRVAQVRSVQARFPSKT